MLAELVEDTGGFSFAYLKELYVSAMVRWMHERRAGEMRAHLRSQLRALREQMTSAQPAAPVPEAEPSIEDLD